MGREVNRHIKMGRKTPLLLGILLVMLAENGLEAQKNIPEPKFSKLMGPTVRFLYCYS